MRSPQMLAAALLAAIESRTGSRPRLDEAAARERVTSVAAIASRFAALAGSEPNAVALVESLRDGHPVELLYPLAGTDPTPKTIAFVPPTGPLDWHDLRMVLMLARDALTAFGILRPTGEQLRAVLVGGEVAVPGARLACFRGVLNMRAEGCSWGRIASERYQRAAVSRLE